MESSDNRQADGDDQFLGVNEIDPPESLPPGMVSRSKNARYTFGEGEPRLGVAKLPWTNKVTASISTPLPYGTVYGASEYRDSDGLEWGIIAADGRVYRTRESNGSSEIPLPPGVFVEYPVTFTQTQQGLVMFRGTNGDPLYMSSLDEGFKPVALEANTISGAGTENPTDGTNGIPQADSGEWIGNRLFVPHATTSEKDLLSISDYLNATRHKSIFSQARINQGSSDKLNRFFKFSDTKGIAFKESSLYALYNLKDDLSEMVQDEITREYGLVAPRSVVQVGREEGDQAPSMVWFLTNKQGVCTITENAEGRLQIASVPISREIDRTIKRIDWRNASLARGAWWDNKFYLAVPLDDGTQDGPNLVRNLTYNSSPGSSGIFVVPGATYKYIPGANDISLTNGIETLTDESTFVAQSNTVIFLGTPDATVTCEVKRVWGPTNNAILVYDFKRKRWAGHDTGTAIMVKEFLKLQYQGQRRLFYLSADGFINLVEEYYFDETAYESPSNTNIASGESTDSAGRAELEVTIGRTYIFILGNAAGFWNGDEWVDLNGAFVAREELITVYGPATTLLTMICLALDWVIEVEDIGYDVTLRGYKCGAEGRKRFTKGLLQLSTWYPQYSLSVLNEGQGESHAVFTNRTKSNSVYYRPFGQADYDTSNVNDDHALAHREDYSISLQENTVASGAIVAGVRYLVESDDVTTACSIVYDGNTYNNGDTFLGVDGVTTFSVSSGSPLVYGPDSYVYMGENGIDFEIHQETTEIFRLPRNVGRYAQYRIQSNRGRCIVKSAGILGHKLDHRVGKHS